MATIGAFARSRALKAKSVENVAMQILWRKKKPNDAEIIRHLSPNEQEPILPWLRTFPKKVVDRFTTYLWPAGTFFLTFGTIAYYEKEDAALDYQHRF